MIAQTFAEDLCAWMLMEGYDVTFRNGVLCWVTGQAVVARRGVGITIPSLATPSLDWLPLEASAERSVQSFVEWEALGNGRSLPRRRPAHSTWKGSSGRLDFDGSLVKILRFYGFDVGLSQGGFCCWSPGSPLWGWASDAPLLSEVLGPPLYGRPQPWPLNPEAPPTLIKSTRDVLNHLWAHREQLPWFDLGRKP